MSKTVKNNNKVNWGLVKIAISEVIVGADGKHTYGPPIALEGSRQWNTTPRGGLTAVYADGGTIYSEDNNDGYDCTTENANLPDWFREIAFGEIKDGNGGLAEYADPKTAGGVQKQLAVLWQAQNDKKNTRYVMYNTKWSRSGSSLTTVGDGGTKSAQYDTVNCIASPRQQDGLIKYKSTLETLPEIYEKWFDEVQEPSLDPYVSESSVTVSEGDIVKVHVNLSNATNATISSNSNLIATVEPTTLTESGEIAITGVSEGDTKITVQFNTTPSVTKTIDVEVVM